VPLLQTDARDCRADRWRPAEPLPAQEIRLAEVGVKIALYSCSHYSVDILSKHTAIYIRSHDGKSHWTNGAHGSKRL